MARYHVRELLPPAYSKRPPDTLADWMRLLREGLPGRALSTLLESLGLSRTELCAALDIPERTLTRRLTEGRLTPEESEKVLRLARVWERANAVFASEAAARDWMKSSNATLQDATPLSLLVADIGAEAVLDLLGRIEHGVFS
jgi:putative toxin-antitoxin system antitoxin component (TIGR02293 family)